MSSNKQRFSAHEIFTYVFVNISLFHKLVFYNASNSLNMVCNMGLHLNENLR